MYRPKNESQTNKRSNSILKISLLCALAYAVLVGTWGWWWDKEPDRFEVLKSASEQAIKLNTQMTTGFISTSTFLSIAETLMNFFTSDAEQIFDITSGIFE